RNEAKKWEAIRHERAKNEPVRAVPAEAKADREGQRFDLASANSVPVHLDLPPTSAAPQRAAPGSNDPIQPVAVKTLNVKGNTTVALAAQAPFAGLPRPNEATRSEPARTELARPATAAPAADTLPPPPPGARPGVLGTLPASAMANPPADPTPAAPQAVKPRPRTGWIIQVGAYPDEDE